MATAARVYDETPDDFETPDLETEPAKAAGPKPPEWWTEENTRQWEREVWGDPGHWSAAQMTWAGKLHWKDVRKASASTYTPIGPKQYKAWAKTETRPIPVTFYDGKADLKRVEIAEARGQVVTLEYWQR